MEEHELVMHNEPDQPSAKEVFADHNLRCTPQRRVLYEALRSCTSHPTVEELHHLVSRRRDTAISLATVYNTVEALCKAGLAKRLPTGHGSCRYDANIGEHLHVRFTDTAEILDVPAELSNRILRCLRSSLMEQVKQELGVEIDSVSIQLLARRNGDDPAAAAAHDGSPADADGVSADPGAAG